MASGDIYDLLSGGVDPGAASSASNLAPAIRQRRRIGELGLLSGNPIAQPFAQEQLSSADEQEKQLQGALGERLKTMLGLASQRRQEAQLQSEIENRRTERKQEGQKIGLQAKGQELELAKMGRLPPEAIERMGYFDAGLQAVDEAERQLKEDPTAYIAGHKGHAAAIAKGITGREMPNAIEFGEQMLPGVAGLGASKVGFSKAAKDKFESIRAKIRGQRDALTRQYGGQGYNVPQDAPAQTPPVVATPGGDGGGGGGLGGLLRGVFGAEPASTKDRARVRVKGPGGQVGTLERWQLGSGKYKDFREVSK